MSEFVEIPLNKASIARRKTVYGVGINDSECLTKIKVNGVNELCPYHQRWIHMMERCYSVKFKENWPTYAECNVCDDWLLFSNFKKWMVQQDWKDNFLDKDLIQPGNKIYCPEKCCFISHKLNTILLSCNASRGKYSIGVYFCKSNKKYRATCNVDGKSNHLGYFNTEKEASIVYIEFKTNLIKQTFVGMKDQRVKQGLLKHISCLEKNIT